MTGFSTPPPSPLPEASGRGRHVLDVACNPQNSMLSSMISHSQRRVTLPQSFGSRRHRPSGRVGDGVGLDANALKKPVMSSAVRRGTEGAPRPGGGVGCPQRKQGRATGSPLRALGFNVIVGDMRAPPPSAWWERGMRNGDQPSKRRR